MAQPGRLGAAVMGGVLLVVLVVLSLFPAMNRWREPYDACTTAGSRHQVVTGTSVSYWPAGVECRLASSHNGEGVTKSATRSTEFVGYAGWVGPVQLLLLASALIIVLTAIWSSARSAPRPHRAAALQ